MPALRDIRIKSEVEDDVGGDVPSVGVETGTGDGTLTQRVAEAEAVAGRKLDKVDDVEANA